MSSRSPSLDRLATSVLASVLLLATACSTLPAPEVESPRGRTFVPMVPDSADDVGLGSSITVDGQGLPYVSYFGFVGQLDEGEIPVARPVGSPYLTTEDGGDAAAVLLSSFSSDQIWNRGAVSQPRETPSGVTVPFGPATEPSLRSLTPGTAAGTDVAVAGEDIHVVWGADTGIWYGLGPNFEIEPIEETREGGTPSIAVNDGGSPLVAYTVAGVRPEVRLAERAGDRWQITSVTSLSACGAGCPPPTEVAIVGGEPLVAVLDTTTGELIAARRQGGAWVTEVVATGVEGGVSLSTDGDRVSIAYYTDGAVSVASGGFGGWTTQEVATVRPTPSASPSPSPTSTPPPGASPSPTPSSPPEPIETDPTTGVALAGDGTAWVTWEDRDGIHLASAAEGDAFEEVRLSHTSGGVTPSVTVAEDASSVYLSWFDPLAADLRVGILAETEELLIAAPSPTATPALGPGPEDCGEDEQFVMEVTAPATVFQPTCLVAPAGEAFTVTFDNQDATPNTPHNWSLYEDSEYTSAIVNEAPFQGPETVDYQVPPLDPSTYFFRCEVHPTQMTGVLEAIEGGGDQGGGGGQGDGGGQGSGTGGGGGGGNG